jgi:hypothetical protein
LVEELIYSYRTTFIEITYYDQESSLSSSISFPSLS